MKLFLIRIGKVWKNLRNNGLISGGRNIFQHLFLFLKTIFQNPSGDVLFLTAGIGDSARFRTYNQAEELSQHGIKSAVMIIDHPLLLKFVNHFKIFIFHRILVDKKIEKFIGEIKKQNKTIIFDTDDFIFNARLMHQTESYQKMNSFEKKQYKKNTGEEILKDSYAKVCTTTTSYLAEKLREYRKQVFIVPNKLSNEDLEVIDNILKTKNQKLQTSIIKLGYFSGTISHNKDFAIITEPLMQIMEKYPNVELFLVGPLDIENKLNKFRGRIKQLPYVPRKKHFENISKIDINLAPLEYNNPFCEAKSELKFFEAGILEIPTVAIKNQTFSEAIHDGINGFLAENNQEWFEKIEKLILDKNLRLDLGKKAREKSLKDYTNKNSHNEEYYKYLKSKI